MVTFVGIHYKEGMTALDSRTRSGKKIDSVISGLPVECRKDNLFQTTFIPEFRGYGIEDFTKRVSDEGVIVVLGKETQKYFPYGRYKKAKVINYRHPSFSNKSFSEKLIELINKELIILK